MVTLIRGTDKSRNHLYALALSLAGFSSLKNARKSLVLSLDDDTDLEEILIGQRLNESNIMTDGYSFSDSGIDALLRRSEGARMSAEIFNNCCMPILTEQNLFDIAQKTTKKDLIGEILLNKEGFIKLIDNSKMVYDDIYILVKGKNADLLAFLNEISDNSIVCIKQANKEGITQLHSNHLLVVTEYDKNSTYNIRHMKTLYNEKNVIAIPYNAEYKDACNSGNLLSFLVKNEKDDVDDVNYLLVSTIDDILQFLNNQKKISEEKQRNVEKMDSPEYESEDLIKDNPLTGGTIEKGRFSKKKIRVIVPKGQENLYSFISADTPILTQDDADIDEFLGSIDEDLNNSENDINNSDIDDEFEDFILENEEDKNGENKMDIEIRDIEYDSDNKFKDEVSVEPNTDEIVTVSDKKLSRKERRALKKQQRSKAEDNELEESNDEFSFAEEDIPYSFKEKEDGLTDEMKINLSNEIEVKDNADITVKIIPKNVWHCYFCGNDTTGKFCPECGTKRPELNKWACESCGEFNPAYSKFCFFCGMPREKQ